MYRSVDRDAGRDFSSKTRVIGDTSDLNIFPEMTPTLAAEIACLLAKAAGKVVAACAGAPLVN